MHSVVSRRDASGVHCPTDVGRDVFDNVVSAHPGDYVVTIHGNSYLESLATEANPPEEAEKSAEQLALYLFAQGWTENQPIRLVACATAQGPLPQRIANYVGTVVYAPTQNVQAGLTPTGFDDFFIGDLQSIWNAFGASSPGGDYVISSTELEIIGFVEYFTAIQENPPEGWDPNEFAESLLDNQVLSDSQKNQILSILEKLWTGNLSIDQWRRSTYGKWVRFSPVEMNRSQGVCVHRGELT